MKTSVKIFAVIMMLMIASNFTSAQSLVKETLVNDMTNEPVKPMDQLFDITMQNVDGYVNLTWNLPVANMEGYYLTERSDDGTNYIQLSVKHFVNVPANSQNILAMQYTYIDKTPAVGTIYYKFTKSTIEGNVLQESIIPYSNPSSDFTASLTTAVFPKP